MTGAIFVEQLKRSWRQIFYWGLGLALLVFYVTVVIQDADVLEQYRNLLDAFPPAMLGAFGLSDADLLTSPEGFIAFAGFAYGIMAMAVFAVMAGLNITANDEDDGSLDVILALPVPRWRVIVEKYTAYALIALGILTVMYAGIILGSMSTSVELDLMNLFAGTYNMLPTVLTIMAVTTFAGSVFSRKGITTAIATAFVIGSYFIWSLGNAVDTDASPFVAALQRISVFTYFDHEGVVLNGLQVGNVILLLSLTIILMAASLFAFERRDIAV